MNIKKILILVITTLLLARGNLFAQDFHAEVSKLYNFYPHKMSGQEQNAVMPALDDFFHKVIKDKDKYLEPLRKELKRNDNNPYFYYDGGILLLEISQASDDLQLISDALVKANLKDIPPDMYLRHLLRLSVMGANVIDAALHILDDATFAAFIPQHSLTLEYGKGLAFILPRYSPDLYIDKLISKFNSVPSSKNKLTCLDLFVYANCCKADVFLRSLTDNAQPEEIRNNAADILKKSTVVKKRDDKKYARLFEERKKVLTGISDEALYESIKITMDMRKYFECEKK